jgi:PRC-barrel domain
MEHATYASRLRYLAADDVDDSVVDYDGLDVQGPDGARIGDVAGFIVDAQAGRLCYVVVDSGGWFRSRRFLLPVGHANLAANPSALRVDVTRAALSSYPAFNEDQFREFSDDDLKVFEQRMVSVCCPDDSANYGYGSQRHYAQPDWWTDSAYAHERLRPVDVTVYQTASPPPVRELFGGEQLRAYAADSGRRVAERAIGAEEDETRRSER